MAFTGKLSEIRVPDLLQIISTGDRSGTLRLTRRDAHGLIVFRRGGIIYAASSSVRETVGSLLLSRRLVDHRELMAALEEQRASSEEKRLGSILVARGAITQEALEELISQQVERVIRELLDWDSGVFRFDLMDISDRGEVEVDARGLLLTRGLAPDKVLLRIATELDAAAGEDGKVAAHAGSPAPADARPPSQVPPADRGEPAASTLRSVISEIRSPEFTGELTVKIMGFAATVVPRGVLFYVRRGHFCGMGQFGIDLARGSPDETVRAMKVPLDASSILADAADGKQVVRGPIAETEWNAYLLRELGGLLPAESIAVPLVVNSEALLVFYGDSAPDDRPIGSLAELEVLMLQAGLAMEKQLLEKRIEQFKRLRARD